MINESENNNPFIIYLTISVGTPFMLFCIKEYLTWSVYENGIGNHFGEKDVRGRIVVSKLTWRSKSKFWMEALNKKVGIYLIFITNILELEKQINIFSHIQNK